MAMPADDQCKHCIAARQQITLTSRRLPTTDLDSPIGQDSSRSNVPLNDSSSIDIEKQNTESDLANDTFLNPSLSSINSYDDNADDNNAEEPLTGIHISFIWKQSLFVFNTQRMAQID
ncbi:hypothetical protein UY3_15307 [Chelonia mydas]|uniref:Uncharacterized protein n=1 Tax=Chelonia mydas TaxID=8469 RepID=M7ASG7_CHEMY|nr:hypothetical protein UY3_15307 [Chelonia mydas]